MDSPIALAEILAVSAIPEFGDLPLELWPGYKRRCREIDRRKRRPPLFILISTRASLRTSASASRG